MELQVLIIRSFYNSFMSVVQLFKKRLENEHYSTAFIRVLIIVIEASEQKTFQELNEFIRKEMESIITQCQTDKSILKHRTAMCLDPVASYFKLMIRKALKKYGSDISSFKVGLLQTSKQFLDVIEQSTSKTILNSRQLFRPNTVILVYSYSRSIVSAIKQANNRFRDIKVIVCETHPYLEGYQTYKELNDAGIETKVILDNQANTYMDNVDMVLIGAQIVLEDGAIISRIGTSTIALSAEAKKKPLYVFAESYKFCRKFFLNESEIPQQTITIKRNDPVPFELKCNTVDFTSPSYIALVCTDLGLFTTAEISDGLIKMFK